MKKVLVIQPLRSEALHLLDERPDITYEVVTDFSPENLLRHVGTADAITVRDAPLPVAVLEVAQRLRVISRHGVGYDNIPVDYCTARGVPVTVVGDVNAISVAEQTMFLMLAAARNGVELDDAVRRGDFGARSRIIGVELKARTLLIVGFGRIGREVAKRALAFGMKVVVHDPFAERVGLPDIAFVDLLADGLPVADVITLHVPLRTETRGLIGQSELSLLRDGAIVINTARGGIIDERALAATMQSGKVRAAGIDTFETEPLPIGHPMLSLKKVVLSPHSAALTEESLLAMGMATVRNALDGLDNSLDPTLVVNRSVLREFAHAR
jgi:D-3-phosphoglycerate dehydrogenase